MAQFDSTESGFEPHRRHCVVVLELYPSLKTQEEPLERLLSGLKKQINQAKVCARITG